MSEETIYTANPGKQLIRTVDGVDYQRIPIKTHLITKADRMEDVVLQYAGDKMQEGDILFISEKAVACTQSRAIPMEDIKPRKLAVTLSRYVTKTPAGIGLGIPETMEMALQECGTLRILFAAFCSVIGKLFHQRGWFYIVAGPKARGIDGPTEGTIPPYDHYVVLTPDDPNGTARKLDTALGHPVAIVDINDLGANILGFSQKEPTMDQLAKVLGDNPLGQSSESTPIPNGCTALRSGILWVESGRIAIALYGEVWYSVDSCKKRTRRAKDDFLFRRKSHFCAGDGEHTLCVRH